jgi:hypothetical protein
MGLVVARAVAPALAADVEAALAGLHAATNLQARREAAGTLDQILQVLSRDVGAGSLVRRQAAILRALLDAGAAGEFQDYASAEQAFMAIQMLAFELEDSRLQSELDKLADALDDDERYRPQQFSRLLMAVAGD